MVVALADWSGRINGRRHDDFDGLRLRAVVGQTGHSWASPFRGIASDNRQYFVKCLQGCHPMHQASLAIEQITGGVGHLIGAPVCQTSLIRIPTLLAGYELRNGMKLQPGLAHASLALAHADEHRPELKARGNDDNSRRQVGIYALYDWCFGSDNQWLYDLDADRAIYSHDHGLYLPPLGEGRWTKNDLMACVDIPHELPDPGSGLLVSAAEETAQALEAVTRDDLARILASVPASWPVTDDDLEALGWFLECRAPQVAGRVRALI